MRCCCRQTGSVPAQSWAICNRCDGTAQTSAGTIDYDSELRHYHQALLRAIDVRHRDRVLDVGCGAGETTRAVSLMASDGYVLGIDIAILALRRAQRLTREAGLRNVDYVCSDAGRHPFKPALADVAMSRFGTMFFADPVSGFTNIGNALRPSGRLVMIVWQAAHHNAWAVAIHRALVGSETALPETAPGPSAFSLGDANTAEGILRTAGFDDVTFEEVREPVYYGPSVEHAVEFVSRFSNVASALSSQAPGERERVIERVRSAMAAHCTRDGVWFDARAWIVTARSWSQTGGGA
jgi:SAM-dependent methyltransferase